MNIVVDAAAVVGFVLVIEGMLAIWRARRMLEIERLWKEAAALRREVQMEARGRLRSTLRVA